MTQGSRNHATDLTITLLIPGQSNQMKTLKLIVQRVPMKSPQRPGEVTAAGYDGKGRRRGQAVRDLNCPMCKAGPRKSRAQTMVNKET